MGLVMKFSPVNCAAAVSVVFAFIVCSVAQSQTTIYVNTVNPGITGANLGGDTDVFARGYYQPSDSGGGWFTQVSTCSIAATGSASSGTVITGVEINGYNATTGIAIGMGITGTNIPSGDTVAAVNPASDTITLAPAVTGTISNFTLDGNNRGTVILDSASHCFQHNTIPSCASVFLS